LILGSAVDTLLTFPSKFDEEFIKVNFKKPSEKVATIVETLFDEFSNNIKAIAYIPEKAIHDACKLCEWYSDDKFANSRVEKLRSEGGLYYNHLYNNKDKYVLTDEEYSQVQGLANLIETHPHTAPFFNVKSVAGVKTFKSVRIDWTCAAGATPKGHPCKSLLDLILINTTTKDIILPNGFEFKAMSMLPIDYKTMYLSIHEFGKNYLDFRYDFQGAFYHSACINKAADLSAKNSNLKLKVLNPVFIVGSFNDNTTAWYQMPQKDVVIGREGGVKKDNKYSTALYSGAVKNILGYVDAIKLYEQYKETGQWDTHPDVINNFGKLGDIYGKD
jgi:hypothetical protein